MAAIKDYVNPNAYENKNDTYENVRGLLRDETEKGAYTHSHRSRRECER